MRKILIMGLPGAGKTTLARKLAMRLNAVHFNADEIRTNINKDLGFGQDDRIEQAHRMGWLCDLVTATGNFAVADFICPLPATRAAFGACFIVWVDRIAVSRFKDTNKMFVAPEHYDVRVVKDSPVEFWVEKIARMVRPVFDPQAPTALFVGRYQPFHDGHKALIVTGMERYGQAAIAVRELPVDSSNPYPFQYVRTRIEHALREYEGRFIVIPVPNITAILYGRDVGYVVERVELDPATETISGTRERAKQNGPDPGTARTANP